MKYDCSKTMDYVHEQKRMCDAVKENGCFSCPLHRVGESCYNIRFIIPKHINIVQKWSDEHPEKTRKEAFFELFPKADADIQNKTPVSCYGDLVGDKNTICVSYRSCATCWNQLYNGEFEKAREE